MTKILKIGLFLTGVLCSSAWAKRFSNQYTEFELPPGWECALEGTEWVCQSTNSDRKREAIIILAAKRRGQQDSLDQYLAYLKQKKAFRLPGGQTQVSEPKYSNVKSINNHRWVDALHMASEVPGFYTRYLATVKKDLGVAVTLSVAKDHYNTYRGIFDKIVGTLRVFRQTAASKQNFRLKKQDEDILGQSNYMSDVGEEFDVAQRKKKKSSSGSSDDSMFLLLAALAGIVGFIIYKKKKG